MPDVIGPNFSNEITAAGLAGLPFSWGSDGVNLDDPRLTPAQRAAIEAVITAHDPTQPDPAVVYASTIAAGCRVVSTATPELSATYAATGQGWQNMRDVALYIASFDAFPEGLAEFDWTAQSGDVIFTDTTQFKAVARAVGDWLTGWQRFMLGKAPNPPTLPVTIP